VFVVPITFALNCCLCPFFSLTLVDGVKETVIPALSVTTPVALFVGSATLVALTVTDCVLVIPSGAV
jgi:hypothetical protein